MSDKCWFPKDSELHENVENSLSIQAPANWIYVGYSANELKIANDGGTKVSCTCQTSGKCNPFVGHGPGGSTAGCAGDCTRCLMEQSISQGKVKIQTGGYINLSIDPYIIEKEEKLPAAFDAMFELPEVKNKIDEFFNRIYPDKNYPKVTNTDGRLSLPNGYLFAVVNICNRACLIPVPKSAMIAVSAGGESASCSCTEGTCTVKSKNIPLIGGVTYCEGSCTGTCTLTTSNSKNELTYTAEVFKF